MKDNKNIIEFTYTNYKGITSKIKVRPVNICYTTTNFHKEHCWILLAYDVDKEEYREFKMTDIEGLSE